MTTGKEPRLEIPLAGDVDVVLSAERLRDGRLALGTRRRSSDGEWVAGELSLLETRDALALAGWLAPLVEDVWLPTLRERAEEIRRTAGELYGEGPEAEERLLGSMLREIPPALLRRSFLLLINSIGPYSRERVVAQLNRTDDFSEEAMLRRRLAEEQEAFGYAVAAAALLDAIDRGGAGAPGEDIG
jgi:hypothetical protein